MTEKQLHKLRRQDLLQLLVAQGKEAAQLQARLDEAAEELKNLQDTRTKFIERMDDKDAQIEKLKPRLDEKDAQIEKLTARLNEKDARIEKLTARLNEKDAQIEKLIGRLNEKDARIGQLTVEIEQYRSGEILGFEGDPSIDEVGQKLNAVLRAAQKAVAQYLDGARAAGSQVAPLPTDMQGQPSKESLPEPADSRPEPSEERAGEGQQGQEERI